MAEIESYDETSEECKWKGVWREGSNDKWDHFEEDLDLILNLDDGNADNDIELSGLDWSAELSASASNLVEKLSGCNVWAHNVRDNLYDTDYLESIAEFKDHRRLFIYPEWF